MSEGSRWIVITGGPFSGKTSLVERLGARGFRTLPEAAMRVIERKNAELGIEGQRTWRWTHPLEFQDLVAREQEAQESRVALAPGEVLFADRGLPDSIGYCRYKGVEPPAWLVEAAGKRRYSGVILLDTLRAFDRRPDTGRTSTYEDSLRIREHLRAAYAELGYDVIPVPELPAGDRDEHVLRVLGLDGTR